MDRRRLLKVVLVVLGVVLALAPALFVALQPIQVLPRMSLAPGFGLVGPDGETVTSDGFKGGFTLYTFDYGACGDDCASTRDLFRAVQERLEIGLDGVARVGEIPVRLVSLTLDAVGDTPDRLGDLAREAGADPRLWTFASGDSTDVVRTVRDGFGFWYERRPEGGFRFDSRAILVDQFGIRRREYGYGSLDPEIVMADLARLEEESRAAGATRFAYEAAHLFACYSY